MAVDRIFTISPRIDTGLPQSSPTVDYTNYTPNGLSVAFDDNNTSDYVNNTKVPFLLSGQTSISYQESGGDTALAVNMNGTDYSTRYIKLDMNFGSISDLRPTIKDGLYISWSGSQNTPDLSNSFSKLRIVDYDNSSGEYGTKKSFDLLTGTVTYSGGSVEFDTVNSKLYGKNNGSYDTSANILLWDLASSSPGSYWVLEVQPLTSSGVPHVQPVYSMVVPIKKGWNLFGTSIDATFDISSNLFVNTTFSTYDGTNVGLGDSRDISANYGYWLKSKENGNITITYTENVLDKHLTTETIPIKKGWNLFGTSIDATFDISSNLFVNTTFSTYDGTNVGLGDSRDISANYGYWLKSKENGNITVTYK